VVKKYQSKLTISYYYKDNSGPGDSRNYGMKKAKGITLLYLIPIVLFQGYLSEVDSLKRKLCGLFRRS
jgi:glycosyltransferase involved in cell wall biosynthesis